MSCRICVRQIAATRWRNEYFGCDKSIFDVVGCNHGSTARLCFPWGPKCHSCMYRRSSCSNRCIQRGGSEESRHRLDPHGRLSSILYVQESIWLAYPVLLAVREWCVLELRTNIGLSRSYEDWICYAWSRRSSVCISYDLHLVWEFWKPLFYIYLFGHFIFLAKGWKEKKSLSFLLLFSFILLAIIP